MKILIMTDLEGVSGVTSWQRHVYSPLYRQDSVDLLTGEVNAAIEGLLAQSVRDILVLDGHGAGGICFNKIHPKAKIINGDLDVKSDEFQKIMQEYDATLMIGQHSMSGTIGGNLAHTQCEKTIQHYKLNGKLIGEIAQWALYCGAFNIPLIFLSGDTAACDEANELIPDITTAEVKKSISMNSAISLSKESAQETIKLSVIEAIDKFKQKPILPLKWEKNYVLEIELRSTDAAKRYMPSSYCEIVSEKVVKLKSDNILKIIYK